MTPEQFRLVEERFHALVDLDESDRRAALRELEERDAEVAAEVARLMVLELETASPDLTGRVGELLHDGEPGGVGERVGPYRLERLLGEGGMGAVYEAEQERPLRRKVALKLIKAGMDSAALVARFSSERQALALMDHPGIARVYDAGTSDAGRPYFAMELVDGEPLTRYCDDRRLSLRRRLELFTQLCDAVQHAHQKGILHRDLKPSNILVEEVDGAARPKVIDFGIAKAITPDPVLDGPRTQLGALIGTPEYMSPEQAASGGIDVDVRSDVYSLGVVLHELLTGELPLAREVLEAGPEAVREHLAREEPRRPSQRLSASPELETISHDRDSDVASLPRSLRGDLDWILLKALARERERRYASASALAEDCRRHLRHEPVEAGPPGALYRASKFVRRHRVLVGAGTAVVLALVVGSVLATVGLVRARAAQRVAQEARVTAEREAEVSSDIADFLVGLFRVSDPGEAKGNEVTARELLDRGAAKVRQELRSQPEVQARLLHTMGDVYSELGLYEPAEELLREALELRRGSFGDDSLEVAATLSELAGVLRRTLRLTEAKQLYGQALEIQEKVLGLAHPDLAPTLSSLAISHRLLGENEEARGLLERALGISEAEGPSSVATASVLNNLATVTIQIGDDEAAVEYLQRALRILRTALGDDHPNIGVLLNNQGFAMRRMGDFEGARDAYRESLAISRQSLGEVHPDIAMALRNLGFVERALGDYVAAREHLEQSLDILRRAMGTGHVSVANAHSSLADLALHEGDLEQAWHENAAALELLAVPEGPQQRRRRLRVLEAQARVARLRGDGPAGRQLCESAVEEARALPEPEVEAGRCRLQLALMAAAAGDAERAQGLYEAATRGLSPNEATFLDDPVGVASRAAFWLAMGDVEKGRRYLELAKTQGVEAWGPHNPDLMEPRLSSFWRGLEPPR